MTARLRTTWLSMLCVISGVMLLHGCGFHLRGEEPVPPTMQEMSISGVAQFSDIYLELKRMLERSGARVHPDGSITATRLTIISEQTTRRVLTVDSQGRASEYELTYVVTFDVTATSGEKLLVSQNVSLLRDYKFDPDNVLAKDTEEAQLRKALVTFAVQQIVQRIAAGLQHKPASAKKEQPSS